MDDQSRQNSSGAQETSSTEHEQVVGVRGAYESEIVLPSDLKSNVKVFAFYLPQFHEIPENNQWWGKGFTEWTNTVKTTPAYLDHYEPRNPHKDIGFYDLSVENTLKKQIELAKNHGINGFAVYYYWFSGKRLLEKPLDILYNNKQLDIEYCIIWANENWTRTWDGLENNVLLSQSYQDGDPELFIHDLKKYVLDPRYLKISGKPVIIVYAVDTMPNPKSIFEKWRSAAIRDGIGEILIWVVRKRENLIEELQIQDHIDGMMEFPPHNLGIPPLRTIQTSSDPACLIDYKATVEKQIQRACGVDKNLEIHKSAMLAWDNSPRRPNFTSFCNFDYTLYVRWLKAIIKHSINNFSKEERIVFINAWNEWAEGSYLEPDVKYGYSALNYTSSAIFNRLYSGQKLTYSDSTGNLFRETSKIAVQVHLFYPELAIEIVNYTNHLPYSFDLLISTDSVEKSSQILKEIECKSNASKIRIDVFPNQGRDIAPFLMQISKYRKDYDIVCHIHTEKNPQFESAKDECDWRRYLYLNLFGNDYKYTSALLNLFETNPELGMVYPETYPPLTTSINWGINKELTQNLLNSIWETYPELPSTLEFPSGNMFWVRLNAIDPLLNLKLTGEDFAMETGQLDGTLAHALERSWCFIVQASGYIWTNFTYPPEDISVLLANRPMVSIVVPVYNSAKFLHECLDSLVLQSLKNIEIICVDDGSSDDSVAILKEYASKDPRIVIQVHETNRGLLKTRGDGVRISSGKYIMFCDADDTFFETACGDLASMMEGTKSDFVQFGTNVVAEPTVDPSMVAFFKKFLKPYLGKLTGSEIFKGQFEGKFNWHIWTKIYSAELCKKAYLHAGEFRLIFSDDLYLSFFITYYSKKCVGTPNTYYNYHLGHGYTGGSSSQFERLKVSCENSSFIYKCIKFLKDENKFREYGRYCFKDPLSQLGFCMSLWDGILDPELRSRAKSILVNHWDNEYFHNSLYQFLESHIEPRQDNRNNPIPVDSQCELRTHSAPKANYFMNCGLNGCEGLTNLIKAVQSPDIDTVSFDIFDTLLERPALEPLDILKLLNDSEYTFSELLAMHKFSD